jgi:hypothetical protein
MSQSTILKGIARIRSSLSRILARYSALSLSLKELTNVKGIANMFTTFVLIVFIFWQNLTQDNWEDLTVSKWEDMT